MHSHTTHTRETSRASSTMPGVLKLRAALKDFANSPNLNERLARLASDDGADLLSDWPGWARPDQAAEGKGPVSWHTWLILGGRGAGKTRTGAEWVRAKVLGQDWAGMRAGRIALIADTLDDARQVMVEGVSGLLAVHDDWRPVFEPSKRLLSWPNGAVAQLFSADDPDSLRGPQFDAVWCDELAKWRYAEEAWDMLQMGLRLGAFPQAVVTTTPRPIALLKRMLADETVLVTHAATWRNTGFLAQSFLDEMRRRYAATRLGRQELEAEIIADDPDALFRRDWIERQRVVAAPEMTRIVVAIDPPAGKNASTSTCGIVCAGLGRDGRGYVLDDGSVTGKSPAQWAERAIAIYHARRADRVVAEVNQGGAMVEAVLREVDPSVPYRALHASRGKRARAEPVAALYEQGRVSHAGRFPALEDELCTWRGDGDDSPDRLDALVWAVSELMLGKRAAEPRIWVM
jgi:predicted phage terminase large subunit-like protein